MSTVHDPDAIVRELTEGRGYVVLEGLFDRETVVEAKERLIELAAIKKLESRESLPPQFLRGEDQVWNLIDKGRVFERMAEEPTILAVFSRILGSELMLGSLAARIVSRESDPQQLRRLQLALLLRLAAPKYLSRTPCKTSVPPPEVVRRAGRLITPPPTPGAHIKPDRSCAT